MSRLNLNVAYDLHSVLVQEHWKRNKLLSKGYSKVTLLQYAAYIGNDVIVSSLIKAGADPRYLHVDDSVRRYLLDHFPKPFLVYLLKKLTSLDCSPYLHDSNDDDDKRLCCDKCGSLSMIEASDRENESDHIMMTKWPCCQQVYCNSCVWYWFCRKETLTSFTCPSCDQPLDEETRVQDDTFKEGDVGFYDLSSCSEIFEENACYMRDDYVRRRHKKFSINTLEAIKQRKSLSLHKWLQLPEAHSDTKSSKSSPSPSKKSFRNVGKFKAMSMKEWSRSHLGVTKADRVERLSFAAIKDQPLRILALNEAGVCVDECSTSDISNSNDSQSSLPSQSMNGSSATTDDIRKDEVKTENDTSGGGTEYGQTALHLAVAYRNINSVKALIFIGANVNTRDNSNTTPIILAAATKQYTVFSLLIAAGADIHHKNLSNVSAFDYAIEQEGWLEEEISDKITINAMKSLKVNDSLSRSYSPSTIRMTSTPYGEAFVIDNILSESFICKVIDIFTKLPEAPICKASSSTRRYFCDGCSSIRSFMSSAVMNSLSNSTENPLGNYGIKFFPYMRFLNYENPGGDLPAHNDLSKSLPSRLISTFGELEGFDEEFSRHGRAPVDTILPSTHTFILYLTDCEQGGETVLLHSMKSCVLLSPNATSQLLGPPDNVILAVKPVKGRILLFPHNCPHSGAIVECVPKLLLRGEARVAQYAT